jgi:hypothetical protein
MQMDEVAGDTSFTKIKEKKTMKYRFTVLTGGAGTVLEVLEFEARPLSKLRAMTNAVKPLVERAKAEGGEVVVEFVE